MKRLRTIFSLSLAVMLSATVGSCQFADPREEYDNTPIGNFEALWNIMDTHYCFFDMKQRELGVDWDSVHSKYRRLVKDGMSDLSLFEVLNNMLGELKDGHVNLYGRYDVGRNWTWKTDYPSNLSYDIRADYLGKDYNIAASGCFYRILPDNIGYIVIETFSNTIPDSKLDAIINWFAVCNGIIIDIRDNGGGKLTEAERVASRFTEEKVICGYIKYKNGPGRNDFSSPEPVYVKPAKERLRWHKPVAVLVNRGCFSSANDFAVKMKALPGAMLFGDRTGGGGGLPFSSELPNGWSVRFSSAPMFDADMNEIESGIEPDCYVCLTESDRAKGVDSLIEAARKWINDMIINP
ncbi:MAG: S41 family peptidase [Bacteroidaceae bacterium]|nr:S41 family peptidase [Bacteroidaceae bacterium]